MVITHFGNLCLISSQISKTHFYPFSPINWIQAKYRGSKNPVDKALCTPCYQNPSISWRFRPIRTKINHHFIGRNFFPPGPNWARTIWAFFWLFRIWPFWTRGGLKRLKNSHFWAVLAKKLVCTWYWHYQKQCWVLISIPGI